MQHISVRRRLMHSFDMPNAKSEHIIKQSVSGSPTRLWLLDTGCLPPLPPAAAWLWNYCIWCNLMDCWTVNMLRSQTAVLPRVKCDGWLGVRGTYGNEQPLFDHSNNFISGNSCLHDLTVCTCFISMEFIQNFWTTSQISTYTVI